MSGNDSYDETNTITITSGNDSHDSHDETNTITITDFSLSDDLLVNTTMADDTSGTITISGTEYGTYDFINDNYSFSDYIQNPFIKVGNAVLDEDAVRGINAIIEAVKNLPEDHELRILFETILMMKKIKNED